MPKYCIDTSGLSHPYEEIPEDIHSSLWDSVRKLISDGHGAVTKEIFDEMIQIDGGLGDFIDAHEELVLMEVGQNTWDWKKYLQTATKMQTDHVAFIREFNGGSPKTICLNDISIIALAKTLGCQS